MVFTLLHDKKRKEKESVPMNKISRKGFLKIAAAAAMSGVTAGALAACNSASGSTASGAAGQYIPGTYEGTELPALVPRRQHPASANAPDPSVSQLGSLLRVPVPEAGRP